MTVTKQDEKTQAMMGLALQLAESAIGLTEPNPRVGCVIVDVSGQVLGQGHTQQAGGAHAEVMALREAAQQGHDITGATAYVTLEPCAHHGRTPPCCDALINAGLARVVVALGDPNPLVAGQGTSRLRAAGVEVLELTDGPLVQRAQEVNIGFLSRMQRKRPWLRLKTAVSLDGKTALENGQSQWITGEAARIDTHIWRKRASAILTGIGTVLADQPRLDVRHVSTPQQPLRVILDSQLRTPVQAAILQAPGRALIYFSQGTEQRELALREAGAELVQMGAADGRIDLHQVVQDLAQRGINELHIEAGQVLSGAFLAAGLVDEILMYIAPKVLGPGRGFAALAALSELAGAWQFSFTDVQSIGEDIRIIARRRT